MSKQARPLPSLSPTVSLIDTHCHLDMGAYRNDLEQVIQRAIDHNVSHTVTIGIDVASSMRAIQLARSYECLSATIGIHPHDVDNADSKSYDTLGELADNNKEYIVGYGEIGLDYVKEYSEAANQRKHFADQLSLARDLKLPVIIHDREAHEDTLNILKSSGIRDNGGIMHCFSGDLELAREIIEFGFYVSIPGVVTFKNAAALQEVAREIPLERMLIETDGPFLSPAPMRGKRNEPAYVLYIAEYIAQLRDISIDDVARATTENACKLFKFAPKTQRQTP